MKAESILQHDTIFLKPQNVLQNAHSLGEQCSEAAKMILSAKRVVVLTGAGCSKASGIPTYRDSGNSLWNQYDPAGIIMFSSD